MKKSLLLGLMATATVSASAIDKGDVVSTALPGRYQITSANVCTASLDGLKGWEAVSATADRTAADQFQAVGASEETGAPAGIVAIYAESAEGISYKTSYLDPQNTYIVNMTVWAPEGSVPNFNTSKNQTEITASSQMVVINGTVPGTDETTDYGFPTEIKPGLNNLSWVIPATDAAADYEIKLLGWNSSLVIADFGIYEATQIADPRTAVPTLDYVKAIRDMYNWGESQMGDLQDNIGTIEAVLENESATQEDLDGAMADLNEFLNEFLTENADDQLPSALDKLPKAESKVQKDAHIGAWYDNHDPNRNNGEGTGRIHSNAGDYYDLGHYQNGSAWGYSVGASLNLTNYGMNLVPGTYIFSVDLKANARIAVKSSWTENAGLEFADGILSIVDANDPENKVEIATTGRYSLSPNSFTKNFLVFKVETAGKYDIHIDAYAKEGYESLTYGSVLYPYGASLYAVTGAEYSKAQLDYEIDVRKQITDGRDAITKGEGYVADATKSWGKAALQEVLDEYTPVIEQYEAMTQDQIIETFDKDIYDGTKGLEVTNQDDLYVRMLASEVYRSAVKQLNAANDEFDKENAKIDALTTSIQNATDVLNSRMYSYATGKDALNDAIASATQSEKSLRSEDYSEEAAASVEGVIAELNDAVSEFKATLPEDKKVTVVDMVGNLTHSTGEMNEEVYIGEGETGKMTMSAWSDDPNGNTAFGIGYVLNEENLFPGLIRVGNGSGTIDFNVSDDAIVQVSFDLYFGNLKDKKCGFKIQKAVTSESEEGTATTYENICGLNCSKYSNNDDLNTFAINYGSNITVVGSSAASNNAIAVDGNKTHFDITLDLGTKKMSCTFTSPKGTFSSEELDFEGVPSRFVVMSDYNNADRRSFFGNLQIKTIEVNTGVDEVSAAAKVADVVKKVVNGKLVIETANGTFNAVGAQVK